jgi:hypothetical protein
MAGFTNRGKYNVLEWAFRNENVPTNLYVALVTSANVPDTDTNILSDLTEIAAGNGYTTGGVQLNRNSTDFDVLTEDDDSADERALIQIKDVVWTASGGAIPGSGDGARYAVLTDDNGTVGNREVIFWWDLSSDRQVSDTQSLTLQDLEMRLDEPA